MTYRVQLTAQAEADIARIFDWLFQRSPEGARRWYEAFWESAERLESNPLSSALAPEDDSFPEEVRQMLFKTRQGRTYGALFVTVSVGNDLVQLVCGIPHGPDGTQTGGACVTPRLP